MSLSTIYTIHNSKKFGTRYTFEGWVLGFPIYRKKGKDINGNSIFLIPVMSDKKVFGFRRTMYGYTSQSHNLVDTVKFFIDSYGIDVLDVKLYRAIVARIYNDFDFSRELKMVDCLAILGK